MSRRLLGEETVAIKGAVCYINIYEETYIPGNLIATIRRIVPEYPLGKLTLPKAVTYRRERLQITEIEECVALSDPLGAKELYIPDSISTILPCAFSGSKFLKIFWPAACSNIPPFCFRGSLLEELVYDPKKIKDIGHDAFSNTMITSFEWPASTCCDTIPKNCFADSKLQNLYSSGNIKVIYANAFYGSKVHRGIIDCRANDELIVIGTKTTVDYIASCLALGMDTNIEVHNG